MSRYGRFAVAPDCPLSWKKWAHFAHFARLGAAACRQGCGEYFAVVMALAEFPFGDGVIETDAEQITLPPGVAAEIPAGENLRVVVMWDAGEADSAWRSSGRQRFESAYCPGLPTAG